MVYSLVSFFLIVVDCSVVEVVGVVVKFGLIIIVLVRVVVIDVCYEFVGSFVVGYLGDSSFIVCFYKYCY